MARTMATRTVVGAVLLVVLCFDGRLGGETPPGEKPVPDPDFDYLAAVWGRYPCADPNRPTSTRVDCFELWKACQPMNLLVEPPEGRGEEIGMTEERIQTAAESRLRAARLYTTDNQDHFLYVNVNISDRAFSIHVGYSKWLHDTTLAQGGMAETWHAGSVGTHGGDAGYILQTLSEHMDRFVVEYLRVNEPSCGRP